jgi:hypothetical protein
MSPLRRRRREACARVVDAPPYRSREPEAGAVRVRKRAIHERGRTGAEEHDASPPHVASIIDNFPAAAATATSSSPPQREPLRVILLTLLTTQGGVPQRHAAPAVTPRAELSSPFSPCPAIAPLISCRIPSPFRRRAPQHEPAGRRPLPHPNLCRRDMPGRHCAGCLLVCVHRHWHRFGLQVCGCRCVHQGAHPMSSGAPPLDPPIAALWTRFAEDSHFGQPRRGRDRPGPVQELWRTHPGERRVARAALRACTTLLCFTPCRTATPRDALLHLVPRCLFSRRAAPPLADPAALGIAPPLTPAP